MLFYISLTLQMVFLPDIPFPTVLSWQTHIHSTSSSIIHSVKPFHISLGTANEPSFGPTWYLVHIYRTTHHILCNSLSVYIAVFSTRLWTPWEATRFNGKTMVFKPNRTFTWCNTLSKLPNLTEHHFLIHNTQIICISHSYFMDQMR